MTIRRVTGFIGFLVMVGFLLGVGCAHHKPAFQAGSPIELRKSVAIADLVKEPQRYVEQAVRIEGTVSMVCAGSGCWAEVQAKDGSTIIARSLDHSVLVPKDCVGRHIVVQGVMKEIPPEAASEPNPEGHECPRPTYLVATTGVELY